MFEPTFVTSQDGISSAVESARSDGRFALDTEFMRERTYRARLCLVQIATTQGIWLIDPTVGLDLALVGSMVADPAIEVVVHAGGQDFQIFHEDFGVTPRNIYDVQVAAAFAGLGASLPFGRLLESVLGVRLAKGESYSDWCKRPLTDLQAQYAADDVRYLLSLVDALVETLRGQGRDGWAGEEMVLLESPDLYRTDPAESWRRVPGRGSLSGRQTAMLKALAEWREITAAGRDKPRNWVVKDATLVEIARRAPKSTEALKAVRGMNASEAERSGRGIIQALETGRAAPEMDLMKGPPRSVQQRARVLSGLADAVVRARCEQAQLATELVATRGELEGLLAGIITGDFNESDHRLLRGWRRSLAGEAVLDLAHGKIAVRVTDSPPYIEEVGIE